MAEMSNTIVQGDRKKGPASDTWAFAVHIEEQANRLAESGWAHEATHLRKWASELKGGSDRSGYAGNRSQESAR
jgi:hypothetical protein